MAEKMQESRTFDGAVKITWKKRCQLGIENVLLKGLRLHFTIKWWNDEKCQTLIMLRLNVVHLDKRKILIFNNLYIIHNNFSY